MEALQKVVELLEKPGTLPQRLAESDVQDGLRQLERILATAVDGGSAFLEGWTKQQQEFVLAVVEAILCASCHLVADGGDKEVVEQIYGLTVQLCIQGLDSHFSRPGTGAEHADEEIPQKLLSLLETAIVEGRARDRGPSGHWSLRVVVSEIPTFDLPVKLAGEAHEGSSLASEETGRSSTEDSSSSENILSLLAGEELVVHKLTGRGSEAARVDVLLKPGVSIVAAARQFALVHVKCMTRLLSLCQTLLISCQKVGSEGEGEKEVQGKVALVVNIVKLLLDLSKTCTGFRFEEEAVQNIIDLAAAVLALFGHTYDNSSLENDYLVETGLGISLSTLIDDFLQLARLVLPNYHMFLNLRTYLVAAMLGFLGGSKGRHEGPLTGQPFPLICSPQVISRLLCLLEDVHAHSSASVQSLSRLTDGSVGKTTEGLPGSSTSSRSCKLRNQVFSLSEERSRDEHLHIVFPEDGQWLDNLVAAIALLHAQGLKESSVAEAASSHHSEEDSAVGSVDSVTVASEDDALFGDLFSESGRHSVASEGNPQTSSSAKKLDGLYNAPLQATREVVSFLTDCIFLADWHQPTFLVACRNLSKENLNVFLQIHFSQSSVGKKQASVYEVVEVESQADLLVQLHKDSFDFLQTLVVRHVLSEELETHLASQILREGDSGRALTADNLVVLARLLLNRSGRTREETDDPLIFMLWKNFVDTLVNKAKSKLVDINMGKASAYLPSLFHMEVLFMAFHAASISGRVCLLQSLLSALKSLRGSEKQLSSGPSLAVWSLLVSRLVLAIRYLALNFKTYPKWLVMHLRRHLRSQPTEEGRTLPLDDRPLPSWAAVMAETIRKQRGTLDQHGPTEVCGRELFDVSEFCAAGLELEGLSSLHLDLCELGHVLDDLSEIWRDKTVKSVEELFVERYVFCLSWSILHTKGPVSKPVLPWDMQIPAGKPLGADFFFGLGRSLHAIIRQNCSIDVGQWKTYILQTFRMIEERLTAGNINLQSWEYLRQGASIGLLLSLLQAGLWSSSGKHAASSSDTDVSGGAGNRHLLAFLELFVREVLTDGSLHQLLKSLSSVLAWYVDALRMSVSDILKDGGEDGGVGSSTDLLFRGDLNRSNQHQLLESAGVDVEAVKVLLRWESRTSWKKDIISQLLGAGHDSGDLQDVNNIFLPALLHGFPATCHPGSAAVVSSLLTLEAVLETLEGLFESQAMAGGSSVEAVGGNLFDNILGTVMTMMLDSTFENVRSKCTSLLDSLIPSQEEQARCRDVYLLRHVEDLCRSLSVRNDVDTVVKEGVIVQAVEAVNCIRVDPARSQALETYFLAAEKKEDVVEGSKVEVGLNWRNASSLIGSGRLSPLILVLKGCSSEVVNMKVLQLLVDFVSLEGPRQVHFKSELQRTFLSMDVKDLAAWLEVRLLGNIKDTGSGVAVSSAVRQLASDLLQVLVSHAGDAQDQAMRKHLVEALLINLEPACVAFEVSSAKAYFGLLVQLAVGEGLLKRLLRSVVTLVEKLSTSGAHLESLKCILEYLVAIFVACGAHKVQTPSSFADGKHGSRDSSSRTAGGAKAKPSAAKKASEQLLHPPVNPGASAVDDATSVDEDEDDAISDGELASLDRDEEDDSSNSEKALASRVCTFTSSGSNFMEQHWYFCYTCDLTVSKGCCSVCARVCHRGHKVVYSRLSRFFCDCGAGGVRGSSCLCLKPRKYVSSTSSLPRANSNGSEPFLPIGGNPPSLSESDSDVEDDDLLDGDGMYKVSLNEEEQKEMLALLTELDVEGQVLLLCKRLLAQLNMGQKVSVRKDEEVVLDGEKVLKAKTDILQLKRAYKSGSLDMKIKAEYSNARDLKSHLASGSIVKSLLTISSRGRLAAGEGDKVTIFDVGQLIGQPTATAVTVDKTTVKPLSKNAVRFELVQLAFNSANESYLAVAGFEDCQVFTVNPRGEVTDRLALELSLQDSHIRRVVWVPGSQVQLMVVTNRFLKIYDLSQDKIAPIHYFTVLEDSISDACLVSVGQGHLVALVLSQQGVLYSQRVRAGADSGPCILTENIHLPDSHRPARGISLLFSAAYKLLFMSFGDGLTVVGRLDPDLTKFVEVSNLLESEQDGKTRPAALHHWKEIFEGSGLFISLSSHRSNSAVALLLGTSEMHAQPLRTALNGASLRVDGIAAYRPMTKERNSVLVLHDDGSLQVFSYIPSGADAASGPSVGAPKQTSNLEAEQVRKLGAALLGSRSHAGANPVFPLDFFEKTSCITADIKIGGDVLRNNDSDGVKASLASDDGFLEGPSASGFKIILYNTNPDLVMVGCRVHVGNTSASHIPSELRLFQRTVRFEEGVRSWYDVPFTNSEALLADEEFTLTVGPTFNGSSLPRIDSLEVYGRSKDDFGWKEKLDAVLDIECQGGPSGLVGTSSRGAKYKMTQSASLLEQVFSDSFHLLHNYYLAYRSQFSQELEESRLDPCRKRCLPVLETVFESDSQPLLQSAARHVLCALFPAKDAYYQAKDSMRLAGVVRSYPALTARLSVGGSSASRVIQEFCAQMQAVCKIALHRQSNLANFLEQKGTTLVDGMVKVLWEILTWDQVDAQTINSLVIPMVDVIYGYAECLAVHVSTGVAPRASVAPAVALLRQLLFSPYEAVRTSCSLAISSTLLQVPLPKQTMLAMDDVVENSRAPSLPSESGSGSSGAGQVMMDEDTSTASVQYCCDGCSTVPILRQRWHCNICPDFDLCEACYEVMDADQLPPPHTRDHSMSAIPIEMDSAMGDGSEMHFSSIDELSDESLLQMATELSLQSNGSPVSCSNSALEANESLLQPSSSDELKGLPISATRSAVNGLLLQGLVDEMQGWMKRSSGSQALPVMQLFYRLASASSGPLVESAPSGVGLDLERLIKFMLQEMDFSVPLKVNVRTNFGEVAILAFMFFNLVLRHWHAPGSEQQSRSGTAALGGDGAAQSSQQLSGLTASSGEDQTAGDGASQLERACSILRQQPLVNYLLNIAQQLTQIYKNPSRSSESASSSSTSSGCGSLLSVRREFASGSYSPFFSDSSAKAHRGDLFGDFHRLMLDSVFRLTYSLIRPEKSEKSGDKEQITYKGSAATDLKLDGWQEVLCNYINNPHTTFIRRYARRLLLHICGSKGHYYLVRDNWKLVRETKRLNKFARKSEDFHKPLSYDKSVKLVSCLSEISEVAAARPRNWQKYCSKHVDLLKNLLSWIFSFGEEAVVQTLKLLMLVFYTGKEVGPLSSKSQVLPDVIEGAASSNSNKTGSHSGDLKKKRSGGEDGLSLSAATTDKSFMDMEQAVDQLSADEGKILRNFIDYFLLEWNAASIRYEAKAVLHGAWNHGKQNFRNLMLGSLLEKITVLPSYGSNIVEYTDLLTWLLGKGVSDASVNNQEASVVKSCLTEEVVTRIFGALCAQNELLANHPNSRIYTTLASLVEFDGYYLESEPCLACSSPEVPYARMKLDNLKSETKFTDNRILVKCVGSHTIQSVTMNVHDARRSKSVKVLNLYYNNRAVADLSELKNNWSLWKRARSCHLAVNQTELKVDFSIPITACNFMIELDSFYENLQASSLESLQCPRCSRYVTDKHGICSNCHENAYQCRQCRNINYENLDSFLCNECGYSKYGRFEFNFMAKPSFTFDSMQNDDDMKKGLLAIEAESENAHTRYQQLLQFKKPLLKLVSSIGETEMDSQQKDSVQQMISVPGSSSFKINRKIAILGVLYGEKCKMAFDSVSKSVQTLEGLRRVLMAYLERKRSAGQTSSARPVAPRPSNRCFGCANTFVAQCLEWLQVLAKQPHIRKQLVAAGILRELFENNIHQGPKATRIQATSVLCSFTEGDAAAVTDLNNMIKQKTLYCLEHHRSMDVAACVRDELQLLSETCSLADEFWESRLRLVFQLLFRSIQAGARHPVIAEHIILPCLRIVSQACTPPRSETSRGEPAAPSSVQRRSDAQRRTDQQGSPDVPQRPDLRLAGSVKSSTVQGSFNSTNGKLQTAPLEEESVPEGRGQETPVNYIEWRSGASYVDFVRRQYITSQLIRSVAPKVKRDPKRGDFLALKYLLKWKRRASKGSVTDELAAFEESSWVHELVLSPCSQAIRLEMCALIEVLCAQSPVRRAKFLNLVMNLLGSSRAAGESAAEYYDLLFKMVEPEDSRLFLTVRGFLRTACSLITEEVSRIEAQEWSVHTDISQGYILHKLVELLSKFLQVPNIRTRFMKENLLAQILEALLALRGLVVQKTKLTGDCGRLLRELLDGLLEESDENKRHFIHACIAGLQSHSREKKDRSSVFILEQLCDIICPTKPEQAYMMVLNKAHTQEEFIRGSMTKNPYSSLEVGPLMRDVKNKICQQLELLGLIEDDYGMELLVAGNIIALDLSVAQVYEQVWRKSHNQAATSAIPSSILAAAAGAGASKECPPMTVTYRLQGLDGEATEPMIKELEEDREESQDPEVEFAIAGVMRECGGLEIVLNMVQNLSNLEMKAGQEELTLVLKLLMFCCKIRANRQALLQLGALGVLLEAARTAFSTDAAEPAEGLLLIVECLVSEANESDLGVSESFASSSKTGDGTRVRAVNAVHMFLEKLSHPTAVSKSNKQQRNNDTVARILPYLTYGEDSAMNVLVDHFLPYLKDWGAFDKLVKQHLETPKDEVFAHQTATHQLALDNFVKLTESIKLNPNGEKLKSLIMERSITAGSIRYLKGAFSIFEKGSDYRSSPEWAQSLEMPSVPIILSMLRGLSRGHLATQECLDKEGILPVLHALEGVSGENEIGAKAENLLDTLADKESKGEGFLMHKVSTLRDATRDEMRRRALQKREQLLMGLGMRRERTADGGERIVVAQPHIEGLAEVEEEEAGLACMVCREGYRLRPTDMLGAYSYSKRMNLAVGMSSHVRAEWVYSTVSHFNVIHFQCHQEAKRADASLKNPKKEWEGATLRNSETLCNNLFPLRGPAVPLAHYARCVDQYWDNLNALGRADGSRLRLLTYDVAMMLSRFATSSSFSVDSKGGGRESNSRLLPFMVQMARHLLDQGGASQRRVQAKALGTYLGPSSNAETNELGFKPGTPPTPTRGGSTDDSVQFMMVQSILLQSLEDWRHHRRTFLQRAVLHAYVQYKHGRSLLPATSLPTPLSSARNTLDFSNLGTPESKRSEDLRHVDEMKKVLTAEQLFSVVQPMLVYVGLVDQIQLFLKSGSTKGREPADKEDRKVSNVESLKDEGSVLSGIEPWETTMKDRLRDVSAMLGFAKDLLEWLEEMQGSQDIQEAFDVAQILGDGLSSHTSCEDFVRDAIASSQFR